MVFPQPAAHGISPDQIAQVILHQTSQAPHVLGAQIGNTLHRTFPLVNMKLEYGGLQTFIKRYCQGKIFWVGKKGPDDIYSVTPTSFVRESAASQLRATTTTFWQAFANPDKNFVPALNPSNGVVVAVQSGQPPQSGFVEVPKLTEDEHRTFAREFLMFVEHGDRLSLNSILEKPDFWPEWSERIAITGFGRYKAKWMSFRFERILSTLDARLAALNLPQQTRLQLLDAVKQSKVPQPAIQSTVAVAHSAGSETKLSLAGSNLSELRQLAHRAIDSMAEDELRRLWIPLGAIGDALRPQ